MSRLARVFGLHLLSNHFRPLHGVRSIAVVSVLQIHVTISLAAVGLLHDDAFFLLSTSIWFGMDLFFFLSGFLIGTLLLPSKDGKPRGGMGRFYARRAFRIVPLYYVVLTLLALRAPLSSEQLAGLPFEYLYLNNYHAWAVPPLMPWAWSLAVEEHFYLVVPIVAALLGLLRSDRARLSALGVLWLVGFGVRYAAFASRAEWTAGELSAALYFKTHTRFDILVAGLFVAYFHHAAGPRLRRLFEQLRYRVLFAAVPVLGAWLLIRVLAFRSDVAAVFAWGTITSLMYGALVLLLLNSEGPVTRFLSARGFLRFATLGYGVYLVHPPVISFVVVPAAAVMTLAYELPLAVVWPASLLLLLVVSTLVAYVLHIVVEKPALWVRDRVAA